MPEEIPEAERFEGAVEKAVAMVGEGDTPVVAADYAAELYDLEHRVRDLIQAVQEEVDDGE
jgi:hypothetical protein